MRWKLGVWIGPPKVLLAPKPTSSVRISRTLGAPAGASTPLGKSGTEPFRVRSIFPLKGGSGVGNTLGVSDAAARGRALDATADAAEGRGAKQSASADFKLARWGWSIRLLV